jgi:hypothetical protein
MELIHDGAHSSMGIEGPLPGVRRPGREDDFSPSSNAEVKNAWSWAWAPECDFVAWYLIKQGTTLHFTILGEESVSLD